MNGESSCIRCLKAKGVSVLLCNRPLCMTTMPYIFDDAEEDGVENFDWCVFCWIKTCCKCECVASKDLEQILQPTFEGQKAIVNLVLMGGNPLQKLLLDTFNGSVGLVHFDLPCTVDEFIYPVLCISILDSCCRLLLLDTFRNSTTGECHLFFNLG